MAEGKKRRGIAYPRIAKKYIYDGREWTSEEMRHRLEHSMQSLPSRARACLQMVEGDVILDVGCGVGIYAHLIAPKVSKVVAIDTLETSIEIARDFFSSPNIDFIAGDLFQVGFPDNSFDCVLFLEAIEHVQNPAMFLQEFHRILKSGGCLIISTPNALSYQNALYNLFLPWRGVSRRLVESINNEQRNTGTQLDHIYCWDFQTLYRLLNRNGFTYVEHAFAGFWPLSIPLGWFTLTFPFWTKKETKVMSLLKPLCHNLVFKVRKS